MQRDRRYLDGAIEALEEVYKKLDDSVPLRKSKYDAIGGAIEQGWLKASKAVDKIYSHYRAERAALPAEPQRLQPTPVVTRRDEEVAAMEFALDAAEKALAAQVAAEAADEAYLLSDARGDALVAYESRQVAKGLRATAIEAIKAAKNG